MTFCLTAGLAASFLLRHRAARAHQVLLTALLASLLMPGVYVLARHFHLGVLPPAPMSHVQQLPDGFVPNLLTVEATYEAPPLDTPEPVPWGMICLTGWALVSTMLLGRLALQFLLGLRLLVRSRPLASERLRRAVESAQTRMGVTRPVRIRGSARIESPIIWCWLRKPVLLVHAGAADHDDKADWVGVFCHELAHFKRRDHLSGLFTEVLAALLPWHLLVWWARARLARLSEQACDDWVLASGHSGVNYAETLLNLAGQRQMAFVPTVVGRKRTMKARIHRIIEDRGSDPRVGAKWMAAIGMLTMLVVAGVAFAQRRPIEPEQVAPGQAPAATVQPGPEERRQSMPAWQQDILQRKLDATREQIREQETRVRALGDASSPERQAQEFELDLLRETAEQIERRLQGLQQPQPIQPAEAAVRENKLKVLRQEVDRLAQVREQTERELESLPDGQRARATELQRKLRQLAALSDELERAIADEEQAGKQPGREGAGPGLEMESTTRRRALAGTAHQERRTRAEQPGDGPQERTPGAKYKTRVYALQYVSAERIRALLGTLIEAPETVTVFASGRKVAVSATTENHLRIEGILKALDVPEEDRGQEQDRLVTAIYRLKHAGLGRTCEIVQSLLGESGKITASEQTNALIVTATAERHKSIEDVLSRLDTPASGPASKTEVDELRDQMRQLQERMEQVHRRLEQADEQ